MQPRTRMLTAALAMVALLAACAPVDDGDTATDDNGADDPTPAEGDVDPDATFRFANAYGPSRFDPHLSSTGQDIQFYTPVYDRLVHVDADGDLVPGLASEFEFVDDEGLEFRMQLQEGVTFHDGEPFDAEAVEANLERAQTLEGSTVAEDLEMVDEVEIVDEHEVVLHLSEPSAMLPGLLSHRAGAMVSPAAFDNDDLDQMPVGAGMYEVVSHSFGEEIVYERYDDYWDDDVIGSQRLELSIMADDTTRFNALQTGEVDLTTLDPRSIDEADQQGFNVQHEPALTYMVLYLNRAESEFGDQQVRQALNHAVDRESIAQGLYQGAATPTVQPFPEAYWAHSPDYPADHYEYDPERARELLAEAGLEDGFSFEMLATSTPIAVQTAEAVQAQLAEVGVDAQIRQVEPEATADTFYGQEDGDALLSQWGGRPDPSMAIELQFTPEGFSNPGSHTTEEMEELHDQALATIDEDEREDVVHDNVAEVVDQAFQVPLVFDEPVYAYHDGVVGFELIITGQPNFRTLGLAE